MQRNVMQKQTGDGRGEVRITELAYGLTASANSEGWAET